MASKREPVLLRGAKLVKRALEVAKERVLASPEPMPSSLARKMKLPNGESLSPALKELFLADTAWLGIDYDDEEAEIESVALEDVVEEAFGEDAVFHFSWLAGRSVTSSQYNFPVFSLTESVDQTSDGSSC